MNTMKKDKDDKLSAFVALRLTPEEFKALKKYARDNKLSLSGAARQLLIKAKLV